VSECVCVQTLKSVLRSWYFLSQSRNSHILWMPGSHYYIHDSRPPVPLLNQINPIHVSASTFLKILLNIILASKHMLPKWSLSLRFPHQNPLCTSPLSDTCHMPLPSHSSWFDYPINIWWGLQNTVLHYAVFSTFFSPCPSWPKYRLRHPILKNLQPMFFPLFDRPTFTPTQNDRQNYSSVYFNRHIIVYQTENKIFCNKW